MIPITKAVHQASGEIQTGSAVMFINEGTKKQTRFYVSSIKEFKNNASTKSFLCMHVNSDSPPSRFNFIESITIESDDKRTLSKGETVCAMYTASKLSSEGFMLREFGPDEGQVIKIVSSTNSRVKLNSHYFTPLFL